MSKRRATIARRLVEVQSTAAMLTTFNEVDMSSVMSLRERHKQAFKDRHGVGLGIASFFVKASVGALRAFPRINAEIQGDEMVLKHYYDIGVAVGASEGLVVPVLRDADRLDFAGIEGQIRSFARKAEDGTLSLADLKGGTFTITNGGVFGSLLSTPILNPPQVAHPRPAQNPGASRRRRRPGRRAADDVRCAHVRPSDRRRLRSGPVPGARQIARRGSGRAPPGLSGFSSAGSLDPAHGAVPEVDLRPGSDPGLTLLLQGPRTADRFSTCHSRVDDRGESRYSAGAVEPLPDSRVRVRFSYCRATARRMKLPPGEAEPGQPEAQPRLKRCHDARCINSLAERLGRRAAAGAGPRSRHSKPCSCDTARSGPAGTGRWPSGKPRVTAAAANRDAANVFA